jgi:hypothetical protein
MGGQGNDSLGQFSLMGAEASGNQCSLGQNQNGPHPAEKAGHGQCDPEQGAYAEVGEGGRHRRIVPPTSFAEPARIAPLPAARRRGMLLGMSRPIAKLVKLLGRTTPGSLARPGGVPIACFFSLAGIISRTFQHPPYETPCQ